MTGVATGIFAQIAFDTKRRIFHSNKKARLSNARHWMYPSSYWFNLRKSWISIQYSQYQYTMTILAFRCPTNIVDSEPKLILFCESVLNFCFLRVGPTGMPQFGQNCYFNLMICVKKCQQILDSVQCIAWTLDSIGGTTNFSNHLSLVVLFCLMIYKMAISTLVYSGL